MSSVMDPHRLMPIRIRIRLSILMPIQILPQVLHMLKISFFLTFIHCNDSFSFSSVKFIFTFGWNWCRSGSGSGKRMLIRQDPDLQHWTIETFCWHAFWMTYHTPPPLYCLLCCTIARIKNMCLFLYFTIAEKGLLRTLLVTPVMFARDPLFFWAGLGYDVFCRLV